MSAYPSSSGRTRRRIDRDRIISWIAVLAVHLAIGVALIRGLGVDLPAVARDGLTLVTLLPDRPPPPPARRPPPPRAAHHARNGAASPPNLRSRATELVAPPTPPIILAPPPPVVVALAANTGNRATTGSAPVRGPGTGSGGIGTGTGNGDRGDGPGDGEGDGDGGFRWLSGRLKDSDYPRAALKAGASGTVGLRWTVGVTGRVTDCTVTRSSGNADLDNTTCRLITRRFRYRPDHDAAGRPVPTVVTGEHSWTLYGAASAEPDEDSDSG